MNKPRKPHLEHLCQELIEFNDLGTTHFPNTIPFNQEEKRFYFIKWSRKDKMRKVVSRPIRKCRYCRRWLKAADAVESKPKLAESSS